jgi:hypothetical protein
MTRRHSGTQSQMSGGGPIHTKQHFASKFNPMGVSGVGPQAGLAPYARFMGQGQDFPKGNYQMPFEEQRYDSAAPFMGGHNLSSSGSSAHPSPSPSGIGSLTSRNTYSLQSYQGDAGSEYSHSESKDWREPHPSQAQSFQPPTRGSQVDSYDDSASFQRRSASVSGASNHELNVSQDMYLGQSNSPFPSRSNSIAYPPPQSDFFSSNRPSQIMF